MHAAVEQLCCCSHCRTLHLAPGGPQYKTQFAMRATGKLRVLPADAKRSVQLLLKATGWARATLGNSTLSITGAQAVWTRRDWWNQCARHGATLHHAMALASVPALQHGSRCCHLPAPLLPAGAMSMQSQTLSLNLAAGDHPIVVEWMQVSGTAKVGRAGGPVMSPCTAVGQW